MQVVGTSEVYATWPPGKVSNVLKMPMHCGTSSLQLSELRRSDMTRAESALSACNVQLRDVTYDDLSFFFEHQRDPIATEMAAFPSREEYAFIDHWEKIMVDDTVPAMTIVVDPLTPRPENCPAAMTSYCSNWRASPAASSSRSTSANSGTAVTPEDR